MFPKGRTLPLRYLGLVPATAASSASTTDTETTVSRTGETACGNARTADASIEGKT